MSKTFCILPFVQVVARSSGSLGPCCLTQSSLNQETISEYWQGSYLRNLKQNMLEGRHTDACSECYLEENKFGSSMRTQSLRDYNFVDSDYQKKLDDLKWSDLAHPRRIEMHVSNLCNLKCLTCSPRNSSSVLAENKLLGISNSNQADYTLSDQVVEDLLTRLQQGAVDLLDLRGGETMMVPLIKRILKELPEHVYLNTVLRIQTNGTVLDEDWKILLQKFSKVEIMLSVDSVEKYNTYIRYPSKWEAIQHFAEWVTQQKNIHCFVACTVSNLNILSLAPLFDWCEQKGLYCHLTILTKPDIYEFTNLPQALLEEAQAKLTKYRVPKLSGIMTAAAKNNRELWNNFCSTIDMRDQHRGNRIFDLYPDLRQYWST